MKTLILVLALTLAAAQPLTAWEDDISNEGANTAEEVRRLREDLREAREEDQKEAAAVKHEKDREDFIKEVDEFLEENK